MQSGPLLFRPAKNLLPLSKHVHVQHWEACMRQVILIYLRHITASLRRWRQRPTWYVDGHSQKTEQEVVEGEVEGVWQIYAPLVALPDVWQSQPYHSHLTGNAQRVQGDERGVSQPCERKGCYAQLLQQLGCCFKQDGPPASASLCFWT